MAAVKIASWNVNGIRSCLRDRPGGGLEDWLLREDIGLACLQEVKAGPEVLDGLAGGLTGLAGYTPYWHCAEKPGYSGTAVLAAPGVEIVDVRYGIGDPDIDREGRVMTVELADFRLVNLYAPHSQRELGRLAFKLEFCRAFSAYLAGLQALGKPVLFGGDLNVAHRDIDLANPGPNRKNAGFLPEERAWMDQLEGMGFVDTFRRFCPDPGHYTWWSQRTGVREKNVGWRIDYFMAEAALMDRISACVHQPLQMGSDHCPVVLELH